MTSNSSAAPPRLGSGVLGRPAVGPQQPGQPSLMREMSSELEQRNLKKERAESRQVRLKSPAVKKTPAPPAPKPPAPASGQKLAQNGIKFNERAEVMEVEKNKVSR